MNEETKVFAVPGAWRIFTKTATGDELVAWAQRALELDIDTRHVRMLASLGKGTSWFEPSPLLQKALRELGVTGPITEEQARRHHLVEVAGQMAKGAIPVESGLEEIHRTVLSPLQHPRDLQVWCDLSDRLYRNADGRITYLDPEKRDAVALAEARKLVEYGRD